MTMKHRFSWQFGPNLITALKRHERASSHDMPKIERIKKRHLLKAKEQKILSEQLNRDLGNERAKLSEEQRLEEGVLEDGSRIFLSEGVIMFFELEGRFFPTLRSVLDGLVQIPQVVVDMGAVKFVVNGADVMRPGVTKVDEGIVQGSIVSIVDEKHNKPLAIGISIMSSDDMRKAVSGKVVLSKHHVGDELWEYGKS